VLEHFEVLLLNLLDFNESVEFLPLLFFLHLLILFGDVLIILVILIALGLSCVIFEVYLLIELLLESVLLLLGKDLLKAFGLFKLQGAVPVDDGPLLFMGEVRRFKGLMRKS
jgi:hypothetical protein